MEQKSLILIIIIVAFLNYSISNPLGPLEGTFIRLPQKEQSAFQLCKSNCSSNFNIKPVCGSDGKTYPNQFDLDCSKKCGKDVEAASSAYCKEISSF
ncbi:hypothetical protein WA026_023258 [Henosepilachna vigintioctopunctata]|uniref:Kazal-like domain-containing protein n=1 Tax=Henosepilachna vigintioctopunctata TaxID=420089 RepID=A0AAW1V5W4_9CUCU